MASSSQSDTGSARQDTRALNTLVYRLIVLMNSVTRPFNAEFGAPHGITLSEWRCMMWLAGNPGTTGQDTAAGTGMDRMSVSRNLRSMERKGMVVRVEDAADRKRWNWQLTGAGWEIYDEILPSALARDKLLTRDLSEDTRATILAFLENSLAGLDRKDG